MMKIPTDMKSFTELSPWWRTTVPTEIVLSGDGTAELLAKLKERGRRPFFIADGALREQPQFAEIFAQKDLFVFDATFSEPRTGDVDSLRALIKGLADDRIRLVRQPLYQRAQRIDVASTRFGKGRVKDE